MFCFDSWGVMGMFNVLCISDDEWGVEVLFYLFFMGRLGSDGVWGDGILGSLSISLLSSGSREEAGDLT